MGFRHANLMDEERFAQETRQASAACGVPGVEEAENGIAFALFGVTMVIIQGGLIGRLVKRYGERQLLISGLLLCAGGLVILPIGALFALIILGAGLTALGYALIYPTSSSLLSYAAPEDRQGVTLSLARSASGLARVIGPAIAGVLYTAVAASAPFFVSAAITAAAVLIVPAVYEKARSSRAAESPVS